MARMIDADALLDEFLNRYTEREMEGNLVFAACEIKQDFADMISNVPTVDAVKVVRCKECKHYKPQKKSAHWENRANYCNRIVTIKTRPYDFCSYGERKDGDENG